MSGFTDPRWYVKVADRGLPSDLDADTVASPSGISGGKIFLGEIYVATWSGLSFYSQTRALPEQRMAIADLDHVVRRVWEIHP